MSFLQQGGFFAAHAHNEALPAATQVTRSRRRFFFAD
jgi:hypothetical protein